MLGLDVDKVFSDTEIVELKRVMSEYYKGITMSEEVETTSGDLDCFRAELSQSDFKVFSDYIYNEFGIKMPDIKRVMLQGRLLKTA